MHEPQTHNQDLLEAVLVLLLAIQGVEHLGQVHQGKQP